MKRGTIILAKFPFTDLSATKSRPGIVVSGNISDKNDCIIAFISSVVPVNPAETDYIITERHEAFSRTGLKKSSVIKLSKLATVNLLVVSGEIGMVSHAVLEQIDRCLKLALGLR